MGNLKQELFSTVTPFKLLNLAKECEKAGILGFASDLYTEILSKYPDTSEANESRLAIQSIASRFESEGKVSSSLSLLEKIKLICRLSNLQYR